MAKLSEGFESALDTVVTSFAEEYNRLASSWKDIETKAAGVTTLAGVFLGFTLNFIKDTHSEMTQLQKAFAASTLIALVLTLVLALAAVGVRERVRTPLSDDLYVAVKDLYRATDQSATSDYSERVLHDRIRSWKAAVESRAEENRNKARYVRWAQNALLAAMGLAATLAFLTLFFSAVSTG